jgi:eukaryotic-like serine/threonine-protein kinase
MTSQQRQRVRTLFEQALDLNPVERTAWVRREAHDDTDVCAEVLSLLDYDRRAGHFLSEPIVGRVPELVTDDGFQPGDRLGVYTITRLLGAGGMGRVYLAVDGRLGRPVALKVLAPELTRVAKQRDRLRREARAAAALTHPGICTVYALDEIGDELVIASEFVDGRTLREEMRPGQSRSGAEVLLTARELAAAVASAHERGIVHRDLKPENVMRARDGRLKVLDFGLARIESSGPITRNPRFEPSPARSSARPPIWRPSS